MPRAVLFDLDGTLIDSVDLHAEAWQQAFAHFGKAVPYPDVRSQLGKEGNQLLPAFLSEEERARFGDDLLEYRAGLYQQQYLPSVKAFPGARDLLARLKQSRMSIGLASYCKRTELGYYLRLVGGASLVDAATTAEDVGRSKAPEVFRACLERLDVRARDAVAVGDSPVDVEDARRAGITTVGVLSGGFPQGDLEAAGCVAVYRDPADLLARIATSPLAAGRSAQQR